MKMTAAEYLKSRGWLEWIGGYWYRAGWPQVFADQGAERMNHVPQGHRPEDAVATQLALDAAEDRAAWDRYFAEASAAVAANGDWLLSDEQAADQADRMIKLRRARFAVEVEW